MASYEIRKPGKLATVAVVHDKTKEEAIAFTDTKSAELGETLECYQIKKIHMTSSVKEMAVDFF